MVKPMGLGSGDKSNKNTRTPSAQTQRVKPASRNTQTSAKSAGKQRKRALSLDTAKPHQPTATTAVGDRSQTVKRWVLGIGVSLVLHVGLFFGLKHLFGYNYVSEETIAMNEQVAQDYYEENGVTPEENDVLVAADNYIVHNPFSMNALKGTLIMDGHDADTVQKVVEGLHVEWHEQAVLEGMKYVQFSAPEATERGLREHLGYQEYMDDEIDYAVEQLDIDALNKEYGIATMDSSREPNTGGDSAE